MDEPQRQPDAATPSSPQRPFRYGRWIIVLVAVAVLAALIPLGYRTYVESLAHVNTASCANHFLQIRAALWGLADREPGFILPATGDTREALQQVFARLDDDWAPDEAWLRTAAAACPESFERDRSIGYVYVGDGLRLGDVQARSVLILFCPGENHRHYNEHCHAWAIPTGGGCCVHTNARMVEILKEAIRRGESGDVPYSARAMAVLQRELKKRQAPPP